MFASNEYGVYEGLVGVAIGEDGYSYSSTATQLPFQTMSTGLELQALIIKEVIPLLSQDQRRTLRTATGLQFLKSWRQAKSVVVDDIDELYDLCRAILQFEQIVCRHGTSECPSAFRLPSEHIVYRNITALSMPIPPFKKRLTRNSTRDLKLCQDAFEHMRVVQLTLVVDLDDILFPSIFTMWPETFRKCVKTLKFIFQGEHLDMETHPAYSEFLNGHLVWESSIWLPGLATFSNLLHLNINTPGVLVGLPRCCNFQRTPPPSFSLTNEEVELAVTWAQQLTKLQTITLVYAWELYSGAFCDGDKGRESVLSRKDGVDGVQWVNYSRSL